MEGEEALPTKVGEDGANENLFITKILKELFDEWIDSSTSHGIPKIHMNFTGNKKIFSIMWALFTFTSFAYCTYTIVNSFDAYYSYNVNVAISRNEELPAILPAITICNINPFNERRATSFILNETKIGKCFLISNGIEFESCLGINKSTNAFDTFTENLKNKMNEDMLISCNYNGIPCDESNFTRFWNNQYGNCYTFNDGSNSASLIQSSSTGSQYGLKMELVVSKYHLTIVF